MASKSLTRNGEVVRSAPLDFGSSGAPAGRWRRASTPVRDRGAAALPDASGRAGSARGSTGNNAPLCRATSRTLVANAEPVRTGGTPRPVPDGFTRRPYVGCRPGWTMFRGETAATALSEAVGDRFAIAPTVLTSDMAHAQEAWRALPVGTVKINNVVTARGASQPRRVNADGFGVDRFARRDY